MAKVKSYKEVWIEKLNKEIIKLDRITHSYTTTDSVKRWYAAHNADNLRTVRYKALSLHGNHFIPKRFPTSEFLFIQLSLETFKNK